MMKTINFLALTALVSLLSVHPGWSQENPNKIPTCQGQDLLEKLKTTDRSAYKNILESAEKTLNGNAFFWKIEFANRPDSYLLGTVHITDSRITKLSSEIENTLRASTTLALELEDLEGSAIAENIRNLSKSFVFTNGDTLNNYLNPDEFKRSEKIVAKAGLPANLTRLMKPWFMTMFLTQPDCELARAKSGIPYLDKLLAMKAKELKIRLAGLETPQEQFNALASLPIEDQQIFLKESLRAYDQLENLNETMVQLYLKRRIGAIWPLTIQMSATPELTKRVLLSIRKKLVDERNQTMARRALPILEKGNAFIAVGALHLPGENGLVNLLEKAGYKLTAID